MDENRILVGMGEIAVNHNPHTLSIIGLGSCVGVALHSSEHHVGGLAHIMLPSSKEHGNNTDKLNKYADVGIKAMLD